MTRTLSAFVALCLLLGSMAHASAPKARVIVANNLHRDAHEARREHAPILIVFTRPHCIYCDRVIDYYLVPMQHHADASRPLLIRQLDMTSARPVVDFHGRKTTQRAFARTLKIDFAPTVVVFKPDGTPGSKPLVGLGPEDYYGGFLERAVEQTRQAMQRAVR